MNTTLRKLSVLAASLLLSLPSVAATKNAAAKPADLLEKAVQFMGGPAVVDKVTTLELHGNSKRHLPNGEEWTLKSVSYYAFPDRYRQEAILPIGETLVTMTGPGGAFLQTGPTGGVPLPESERQEITKSVMRNPLVLLQRRKMVKVAAEADQKVGDRTARVVRTDEPIGPTRIAIDAKTGEILQIAYAVSGGADQLVINYSDYRPVGLLRYPFTSSATVGGKPAFSFQADKVSVNQAYEASLFAPATIEPADTPLKPPAATGTAAPQPQPPQPPQPAQTPQPAQPAQPKPPLR